MTSHTVNDFGDLNRNLVQFTRQISFQLHNEENAQRTLEQGLVSAMNRLMKLAKNHAAFLAPIVDASKQLGDIIESNRPVVEALMGIEPKQPVYLQNSTKMILKL